MRPRDHRNWPMGNYSKAFPLTVVEKGFNSGEVSKEITLSESVTNEEQIINHNPVYVSEENNESIEVDEFPFLMKDYWFWLGTGYNYVSYEQTVDNFSKLTYESFKGPTLYASGGFFLTDKWGFEGSYKNTVGEITTPSGLLEYNWQIINLEALHRAKKNHNGKGFIKGFQWIYRGGIQHHTMPFLFVPNLSQLNVTLKENTILTAHLGFNYYFSPNPRFRYELMLRYQYPVSASSDQSLSVSPSFAIDGSVGFSYKMTDDFHLGAHWYGQWHKFKYEYGNGANFQSGQQNLVFSNFDIRIGVEY